MYRSLVNIHIGECILPVLSGRHPLAVWYNVMYWPITLLGQGLCMYLRNLHCVLIFQDKPFTKWCMAISGAVFLSPQLCLCFIVSLPCWDVPAHLQMPLLRSCSFPMVITSLFCAKSCCIKLLRAVIPLLICPWFPLHWSEFFFLFTDCI